MKDKKLIKETIREVERKIKEGVESYAERAYLEGVYCSLLWVIGVKPKLNLGGGSWKY